MAIAHTASVPPAPSATAGVSPLRPTAVNSPRPRSPFESHSAESDSATSTAQMT